MRGANTYAGRLLVLCVVVTQQYKTTTKNLISVEFRTHDVLQVLFDEHVVGEYCQLAHDFVVGEAERVDVGRLAPLVAVQIHQLRRNLPQRQRNPRPALYGSKTHIGSTKHTTRHQPL